MAYHKIVQHLGSGDSTREGMCWKEVENSKISLLEKENTSSFFSLLRSHYKTFI